MCAGGPGAGSMLRPGSRCGIVESVLPVSPIHPRSRSEMNSVLTAAPPARAITGAKTARSGRLMSLDVFRGLTIAGMLLVNNPGTWSAVYPPLRHAEWHGWTPTDLIFPFFLFIVGVAMTFSFAAAMEKGSPRPAIMRKAASRGVILFALGLVLHSYPWIGFDFDGLRIPGVLQRIAVASVVAAGIVLWSGRGTRAAAIVALLLGYWAVMEWVPVPGSGRGVLEPGRDLGAYIDRRLFGTDHLWAQSRTWDPEGLLSTIPAVATVLIGVFVGEWLRGSRPAAEKARGLAIGGAGAIIVGLAWDLVFPINKPLWTSSYVIFTAGMAAITLALCFWLIEVRDHRRWGYPFLVLGVNAITAYFLSSLSARVIGSIPVGEGSLKTAVYRALLASGLPPVDASLAFAIGFVLFWIGVMWVFYRRGILIKI